MSRIYVASSWRNNIQPTVVEKLRAQRHEVYDFKNPKPGDDGFHWSEVDPAWQKWDAHQFRKGLLHELAIGGFDSDMTALRTCDICVLVLPCGRSAHLEAGWAAGAGKKLYILLDDPVSEPELMYLMAGHPMTHLCVSIPELLTQIGPT